VVGMFRSDALPQIWLSIIRSFRQCSITKNRLSTIFTRSCLFLGPSEMLQEAMGDIAKIRGWC
jgi:hypothetical protein